MKLFDMLPGAIPTAVLGVVIILMVGWLSYEVVPPEHHDTIKHQSAAEIQYSIKEDRS